MAYYYRWVSLWTIRSGACTVILTIQGHVLMLRHAKLKDLLQRAGDDGMMPFSVSDEGNYFQLSHPLSAEERIEYRWLYELQAAKLATKQDEDGSPDDDGPRAA